MLSVQKEIRYFNFLLHIKISNMLLTIEVVEYLYFIEQLTILFLTINRLFSISRVR